MKYTKFADIPEFTRGGNYRVNVGWNFLEKHLEHWNEPRRNSPLVLDPDFQRAHVWTEEKQIKYVEYVLRNGQSSRNIYFNCSSWQQEYNTPVELVDGKQRLEAVRAFLRNEIPAFNSFFKEYTDRLRMGNGCDFVFHVNNLKTRKEVLQWYLDLNEGGVVHTTAELNKVKKLLELELKPSKLEI